MPCNVLNAVGRPFQAVDSHKSRLYALSQKPKRPRWLAASFQLIRSRIRNLRLNETLTTELSSHATLSIRSEPVTRRRPRNRFSLRKEVIQPQVLLQLPCYDFTPIMNHTLGAISLAVRMTTSSTIHFRDVTGGVYKARERIHRVVLIRDY